MTDHGLLGNLLIIYTVAIGVVFLFDKLKLPAITGFLVAGILIGPHSLNLISDIESVKLLAEIGVMMLLFTIGIEFSMAQIAAQGKLFVIAAPIQMGGVIVIAWLVGLFIGLPTSQAIFWGFLLSLSSTAIVLNILAKNGEIDSIHGRSIIGILIFQDLAVVPMILLTPILSTTSGNTVTTILITLVESVATLTMIVFGTWYVVPKVLEHIVRSRSRELFLLTIIVLCLGIAWLTSLTGLSLAVGAFIAGFAISESKYSHQATAEVLPFRDSFNSLFFVSIGTLMDWHILLEYPSAVISLLFLMLLIKFLTGTGAVLSIALPPRSAIMTGIALAQIGEFSFILAQVGNGQGLLNEMLYQIFLAVSILSMMITPFFIQVAPRIAKSIETVQRLHRWLPRQTTAHVLELEGRNLRIKDHVIIVGYGLSGRNLVRVLSDAEVPYVALDLNSATVHRESQHGLSLYYGDGTNSAILEHMKIKVARALVVTIPDPFTARRIVQIARNLNPSIHIVVRTRFLRELAELHQLGADDVVPEEFETSIEIFALVLRIYSMPQDFVMQKTEQVRREAYALLHRNELPELAYHLRGGTLSDIDVQTCRLEDDSSAIGKTIDQLALRQLTGASIITWTRDSDTKSNPSPQTTLLAGDTIVILGTREQIRRAMSLICTDNSTN